ncbi:MAG TPA: hypothetical protein VFL91_27190 [Thermomicrobiales bacterium]|nr:hypothetical protein [Thermomicrobiales bacterium]
MAENCQCGCFLVEKDGLRICPSCGGAYTPSGKYLPPHSGWDIPALTPAEVAAEWGCIAREDDERDFWRVAFS